MSTWVSEWSTRDQTLWRASKGVQRNGRRKVRPNAWGQRKATWLRLVGSIWRRVRGCRPLVFLGLRHHVSSCGWLLFVGPTLIVSGEIRGEIRWCFGKRVTLVAFCIKRPYICGKIKNPPFFLSIPGQSSTHLLKSSFFG